MILIFNGISVKILFTCKYLKRKGLRSMAEKMECPICGKVYDVFDFTIGESGNPICINCAQDDVCENDNE